jgi:hypothetical protein
VSQGLRSAPAIVVAALAVAAVHARVPHPSRADQGLQFVPRPEVARVAALGFRALVADYFWMQAVQVVGAAQGDPVKHAPLLAPLIDVVTTVDPWVGHPYRFAANFLIDTEERVRFANQLLERGIEHQPEDWRNHFYLGFNHFFYLGENGRAADALEGAAALPESPIYLRRLVARLRADEAGLETASAFLQELVRTAEDDQARAQYEEALREVEVERRARFLDEARARFRERAGRDIASVAELARGPHALLRALPPEPNGAKWVLDEESGRIVSSHYGRRYEPWIHGHDRQRQERWRELKLMNGGSQ